jgi:rod shape-determining protein MreC
MKTLRRRILDYSLAVLLLAVPILILYSSLKNPDKLNGFDHAVLRVSSPLQAGVSWMIGGAGGVWNRYVWLVDVEEENAELRAENRRLRQRLAEVERAVSDSALLESLIDLKRSTAAETVGAHVTAASMNSHFRVVRIKLDRGESEVEPGMPVIDANGLVGRIQNVYGNYSDVLLVTDPQSSIDIRIPRTGGRGVLTGLSRDDKYLAEIEYLERDKEVQVGDMVVTSGLGTSLPAGIPVGKIAKVKTTDYGLYQEVEVVPTVDFTALETVLIVLAPPPPADPDAGESKRSGRAFGARPF